MLSIYNIVKELVCISFYNEEAYEKSLMELFQNLGYNAFYGPDIERRCESCHTYVLSTLLFLELMIIKYFHHTSSDNFFIPKISLLLLYKWDNKKIG